MTISRRDFLSMAVMTPLAMKLMAQPFQTIEMEEFSGNWNDAWSKCDEFVRRYSKMYFTGFKAGQANPILSGQFLWMAVATFRTGRKATVFYYVNMSISPSEVWNPEALIPHIDRCLHMVNEFKDQFKKDGTICTVHHRRRRVAGVEFYPYGPECPQHNPDPRTMEQRFAAIRRKVDQRDARRRANASSKQG